MENFPIHIMSCNRPKWHKEPIILMQVAGWSNEKGRSLDDGNNALLGALIYKGLDVCLADKNHFSGFVRGCQGAILVCWTNEGQVSIQFHASEGDIFEDVPLGNFLGIYTKEPRW